MAPGAYKERSHELIKKNEYGGNGEDPVYAWPIRPSGKNDAMVFATHPIHNK